MTMKILSIFLLAIIAVFTGETSWAASRNIRVQTDLALRYDDNVFQYSNQNLKVFNPTMPKFSGLSDTNDLIWIPSLRATYHFRRNLDTRVSVRISPKFYTENSVKNYQVYTFSGDKGFSRGSNLLIRYRFIPNFFLRPLADPSNQTVTYAPADLSVHSVRMRFEKEVAKPFSGGVFLVFEIKDYNENFNERDTTVLGGGIEVNYKPSRGFRITFGGGYEDGRAQGENDVSFNSDISYTQWEAYARSRVRLTPWLTLSAGYRAELKNYTTILIADTNHHNRDDTKHTERIKLNARLSKKMDAYLRYMRIDKDSNRSGATLEFAGFNENRITVGVVFKF